MLIDGTLALPFTSFNPFTIRAQDIRYITVYQWGTYFQYVFIIKNDYMHVFAMGGLQPATLGLLF